jgi:hypothetical protein
VVLSHLLGQLVKLGLLGAPPAAGEGPCPDVPAGAQIAWINKRAGRVASMLSVPRFEGSAAATDLREAIRALKVV